MTIRELRTAIELARSATTLAASVTERAALDGTRASLGVWMCEPCRVPAPRARRGLDGRPSSTEPRIPHVRVVVD